MTSAPRPRRTTAADAVVAVLRAHDVDTIFALPGEENLPVMSALRDQPIEVIVCRHEQQAAFMAVAHARLTGAVGVCLATLGPGALNLFTGLAQAELLGVPVLAITGQKARRDNDEGSFQVIDVVGAASAIIAHATSVDDPRAAAITVADALARASSGSAALVELPEDVADAAVESATPPPPLPALAPVASDSARSALLDRVRSAERPLILAGIGATAGRVPGALTAVADGGFPVLATQMGKGAVPEDHPQSLRSLGIHRRDHVHLALDDADLVIAVGYQPVEHPPLAWSRDGQPIVHVHGHGARRERGYAPALEVIGDPAASLTALAEAPVDPWATRHREAIENGLTAEAESFDPRGVAGLPDLVADAVPPETVVALDNGLYKIWFARRYPARHPHALVLDNALATMGAGLATGMVAARLGRRALTITGDGGFLMNGVELETAVRLGLDLTVLVLRDDRYGFIAWHQREQERTESGVDLGNPDLVAFASSFGARGVRIDDRQDLAAALAEAPAGVTVIDHPISYEDTDVLEEPTGISP